MPSKNQYYLSNNIKDLTESKGYGHGPWWGSTLYVYVQLHTRGFLLSDVT